MLSNIRLFFTAGTGRATNDANNRIREDILLMLLNPPEDYILDNEFGQQWQTMCTKWRSFIHGLYNEDFNGVKISKVANRKKFDLEINYLKDGKLVHKILGEFKHNCKTIAKLPQYYSASESKGYIPNRYADYFYDQYLDKVCALAQIEKLNKETYMKYIYQNDHNVDPFFIKLREVEESIRKEKKKIVNESIKNYLNDNWNHLSIELFKNDISDQQKKTFILWDCKDFYYDRILPEELELVKVEKVLRNNTVVVSNKAGTEHHMLLRWRNHLGTLYPAWQISLKR